MTPHEALVKAVQVLGTQTALAVACGDLVKQQNVWSWLNRSGQLPPQYALKVQKATTEKGDQVKASELCPDVFGDEHAA